MLARCPSCRNTFSTDRTGRQDCPVCGKALVVPEIMPPPAGGAAPSEEPEVRPGTPWERRAELGFLRAWAETVQLALIDPVKLFRSARLDRGAAQLGFAVFTGSVFFSAGTLVGRLLRLNPGIRRLSEQAAAQQDNPMLSFVRRFEALLGRPAFIAALVALSPILVLVTVYLNAAVTHACAIVLRQNRRGFPATFAACTYSLAPTVLYILPLCAPIGTLWVVVLTGIGLKEMHSTGAGGAIAVTLAPYVLLCCAGCVAAAMLGLALRSAGGP